MPRYKLPSLLMMMVEPDHGEWKSWMSKRPSGDLFLNGTFFTLIQAQIVELSVKSGD